MFPKYFLGVLMIFFMIFVRMFSLYLKDTPVGQVGPMGRLGPVGIVVLVSLMGWWVL